MLEKISANIIADIAQELNLSNLQVEKTLNLLLDDCTVPFLARYRKEITGGLDEVQIRNILESYEYLCSLNERKELILRSIAEQGKLSDELKTKILSCRQKAQLEDIYLPYKPKKRTRGQLAAERGLAPLAEQIFLQDDSIVDLSKTLDMYIGKHIDLKDQESILQGVRDYLAEKISEIAELRHQIRQWTYANALFKAQVCEEFKDKKTKYNNYYNFSEPVKSIAGHRLMALRRGEKEKILSLSLEFDEQIPINMISTEIIKAETSDEIKNLLQLCCIDAYKKNLAPSIETEIRLESKNIAEESAISIFSKNLRNLLLLPPIPKRVVLGIDPGLRTGSKLVVIDKTGKLLDYATIFPMHEHDSAHHKNKGASNTLLELITKYGVSLISIGNGTAGREMESFVEHFLAQNKELTIRLVMVNEAGASVYSASEIAREEFPKLDITYRGAVSIARRLQDPLAELVKIDPKSIGVGQYQHDVNQAKLKKQLSEVVESCVNYVGVNLNTASPSLLSYVAGIGPSLAKDIIHYRQSHGEFKNRQELMQISGFGPKTFEQSAGFLRIADGINPLDNTAVHPESYRVVEQMAASLSMPLQDFLGNKSLISQLKLEDFVSEQLGLASLRDITFELAKPGRDPREDGAKHVYNREIRDFSQLQEKQILVGTVSNVTNFGAFVDIGVHQDGLVHISEISNQFIQDISKIICVGDCVKVMVISIDKELKRINLSMKACEAPSIPMPAPEVKSTANKYVAKKTHNFLNGNNTEITDKKSAKEAYSAQDLLNKFNSNRV